MTEMTLSPDPLIRWRSPSNSAFEAWASRQLDLETKAPDPRGVLRTGIRTYLKNLVGGKGDLLYTTFTALTLKARSDVENVLFTNVDATGSIFRRVASEGVVFEFAPRDPSGLPEAPPLGCCSSYEMDQPGRPPAAWEEGDVIMQWTRVAVPSLATATRSGPVWWDLRRGTTHTLNHKGMPAFYSVQMVLHGPREMKVNAAAKVKVITDAAVLALCYENGRSTNEGIQAFALYSGLEVDEVRQLMLDPLVAVFGSCAMVTRSGQANPPDTGCVHGSLVLDPGSADQWLLSGTVRSLKRRVAE